jgi:hypothetical protein
MRQARPIVLCASLLLLVPASARADATVFVGTTPAPGARALKGAAFGVSLLFVGLEFEYATAGEDAIDGTPSLSTAMGNLLLQTPLPIAGFQPYATGGFGLAREQLDEHEALNLGVNAGAGVKVSLVGPLRARIDYRVFRLAGTPIHGSVQRVYAGMNLAF